MDNEPPAYDHTTKYGSTSNINQDMTPPSYNGRANEVLENGETLNSGPQRYTYEELIDGFTCPTCQGTGKIPRGQADDLVALIPYRDARLKPRRTVCYVFLSISACVVFAGVLIAFLLPRPISFNQTGKVRTVFTSYNQTVPTMTLVLETDFEIWNQNFVTITGESLTISASWSDQVIGTNITAVNNTVSGRRGAEISGNVTVTFTESTWVSHCVDTTSATHLIYMRFMVTYQYGLLAQNQQSTILYYKAVSCKPIKESIWPGPPETDPRL